MSAPGNLVEYLQAKRLVCALCLRSDHKDNLYVRTEDNREDRVAVSKVVLSSPVLLVTPNSAPEEMVRLLKQASSVREQIASQVSLEEAWELLVDEDEDVTLADLAGLVFAGETGPEQLSGLYRALANDKLYFQRKGDNYRPRSRELVAESQARLKTEDDRAQERDVVGRWLKDLWTDGNASLPEGFEKAGTRYLTWIREVALAGPDASRFKDIAKLFKDLEISGKDAAFRIMVRSGQWSEDENLLLHRFHTPIEFAPELEEAARRCTYSEEGRRDLRHLDCITIDDADTTEIDDALSLEVLEDGFRVGIHIADASAFLEPGSTLDREARDRGTAIYLPERKIRMLPECLGDDAISLVADRDRPSFTFLVDVDRDFNITGHWMGPALIHVRRRLTYSEADELLEGPPWAQLLAIARSLRGQREKAGAVTLPFPRTTVKVGPEGQIEIERESPSAPSQVLVSEMMILGNRLSGEFLSAHAVPALFRSQPPPDKPIPADTEFTPETLYRLRRLFRRGEIGLVPARHNGLGLDAYTQATSPIRRYCDLVVQRQLKSMLSTGEPFYTTEEVEEILHQVERSSAQADLLEKDRRAYWTLRYLEQRRWQELDALVLQNMPDKHVVQITSILWETDCPLVPRRPLPPGTRLKVRIELVWPREQLVRVTPVMDDEKE